MQKKQKCHQYYYHIVVLKNIVKSNVYLLNSTNRPLAKIPTTEVTATQKLRSHFCASMVESRVTISQIFWIKNITIAMLKWEDVKIKLRELGIGRDDPIQN